VQRTNRVARLSERARERARASVAIGTTRGQHSTFSRLTYPASSLSRLSFLSRSRFLLSLACLLHLSRPTRRLLRARERIIALIASRAGDARSRRSLFVILAVCLALSRRAYVAAKERKKTGNGVRMHRRCGRRAWKVPSGFAESFSPRSSTRILEPRSFETGVFRSRIETTADSG